MKSAYKIKNNRERGKENRAQKNTNYEGGRQTWHKALEK